MQAQTHHQQLDSLMTRYWEWVLANQPERATWQGYPGHNDRWTDLRPEAIEDRKKQTRLFLDEADAIDANELDEEHKLNHSLLRRELALAVEGQRFPSEYLVVSAMGGPHAVGPQYMKMMPHSEQAHYDDLLSRLQKLPDFIRQSIELLRLGLEAKVMPPQIVLGDVLTQVRAQVHDDPMSSPMLEAFINIPVEVSDHDGLKERASRLYLDGVVPALSELEGFLRDTYIPSARTETGWSALPEGQEWYSYLVRVFTTMETTPEQVHQVGLDEVARIRAEMDRVISESGSTRTFDEFTAFLRTDPQFFFTDTEDLLAAYRDICKRADPELARMFGKLPRLPYGVIPVPSYSEKTQTTAYYSRGSMEMARPGYFYANTYNLAARPKWEMEALSLHEAVPGHHLQISLAAELEDVPDFRKHSLLTAYTEGWGLYAESLGPEMGFYQDPYSRFGQLTYEMWRAIRLVVDTGMHALGWSREKAIDYFMSNAGKAEHDIVVEVDRYLCWPGQAISYKTGELKMQELRRYAQQELGPRFDIRAFHDEMLGAGPLPLEVLDRRMRAWVQTQR